MILMFSPLLDCTTNCSVFPRTVFCVIPVILHAPVVGATETLFLFWLCLAGSVVERSTPSSCCTWKTTKLNCVFAPKMPMDRAAVYSRNPQLPLHLQCSFIGDFGFLMLNGKLTCLGKMISWCNSPWKLFKAPSIQGPHGKLLKIFWKD